MNRDDLLVWLKLGAAAGIGLWTSLHPLYQTLAWLILADILTGWLASVAAGEPLSRRISERGIARKSMEVLMVAVAIALEPYAGGIPLGAPVAGYWCLHEGLSIVKNCERAGLPVPPILRRVLSGNGRSNGNGEPGGAGQDVPRRGNRAEREGQGGSGSG